MKPQATPEPPHGDHWGRWFVQTCAIGPGGGSFVFALSSRTFKPTRPSQAPWPDLLGTAWRVARSNSSRCAHRLGAGMGAWKCFRSSSRTTASVKCFAGNLTAGGLVDARRDRAALPWNCLAGRVRFWRHGFGRILAVQAVLSSGQYAASSSPRSLSISRWRHPCFCSQALELDIRLSSPSSHINRTLGTCQNIVQP